MQPSVRILLQGAAILQAAKPVRQLLMGRARQLTAAARQLQAVMQQLRAVTLQQRRRADTQVQALVVETREVSTLMTHLLQRLQPFRKVRSVGMSGYYPAAARHRNCIPEILFSCHILFPVWLCLQHVHKHNQTGRRMCSICTRFCLHRGMPRSNA